VKGKGEKIAFYPAEFHPIKHVQCTIGARQIRSIRPEELDQALFIDTCTKVLSTIMGL
jgi:hypothetical protein